MQQRICDTGIRGLLAALVVCGMGDAGQAQSADVQVLTHHNNSARTGAMLAEKTLTAASVPGQFGKLFAHAVDGQIYAQPLYVSGLDIPGKGTHNVVYVATAADTVYAFD